MTTHRIFVYGSLLSGQPNYARFLAQPGAEFKEAAVTDDGFLLLDLGFFPGMVRGEGEAHVLPRVFGEVYEVDDATLARLDRLEGHPTMYRREKIKLHDGSEVEAYLYQPRAGREYPVIASGDWIEHVTTHRSFPPRQ